MSIKKPHAFTWGQKCLNGLGLDSLRITGVTLSCDYKMEMSITPSYTLCTTPFHLLIRRSPLCVGASACLIWGVGCAVQSKPTPRLSSKGITGAGHLAGWKDAEYG